jgi:diguanylate cyclase (GGDEF)-like protein
LRQSELKRLVRERTAELETLAVALQRESAALEEASLTDPLTGLRNRRFLTQHIEADAALAVREYESHFHYGAKLRDEAGLIFFLFDIDEFKQVNDRYGHAAGDAVIRQMSARLIAIFRDTDYLVRWGGEEFLVVARATPRSHAADLAERARACRGRAAFRPRRWPAAVEDLLDWFLLLSAINAACRCSGLGGGGQDCRCGALRGQERWPQWLAGSARCQSRVGRSLVCPVAQAADRLAALG